MVCVLILLIYAKLIDWHVVWKWHNAFHMLRGNLEKLGLSAWHERNENEVFHALA